MLNLGLVTSIGRKDLEEGFGWEVAHLRSDEENGWHRVVPSPKPLEVVELETIKTLLENGIIADTCGG